MVPHPRLILPRIMILLRIRFVSNPRPILPRVGGEYGRTAALPAGKTLCYHDAMIAFTIAILAVLTPVGGDTHDFGEVLAGERVLHTFILENRGDRPFDVVEVLPTCSLESVSAPSKIPPGELGEFPVVLDTGSLFGPVLRGLTVKLSDGEREVQTLFKISGMVHHPVEIVPEGDEGAGIGWMGETVVQAFSTTFHDPALPRVDLLAAETVASEDQPLPPVASSVEAAPDGRSARVVLRLDAKALVPGEYRHWLNIRTTHPQVPLAQIPVAWLVRDPFLVSPPEVVFHGPSIFHAVEVRFPCRAYRDEHMKQPLSEPLGGKGFHPLEARGEMTRVRRGQTTAWVASSCLSPVPPAQAGKTKHVAVADGLRRPLRIGSISCAHPLVSVFWRQSSESSCALTVTLAGEPEREETVLLELEIESPVRERREIPIRLVKE